MNKKRSFFGVNLLPVALLTLLSLELQAQSSGLELEEVVVTAQKREQTLRDVPASVSAVSEEYLNKTNSKDFRDLGKIASGIEISGESDGSQGQVRVRGVGTNKNAPGIAPSVGIFVDDIPLVRIETAFLNLADIERIEILKGPQSTLFGKGVSSGAISMVTKRPTTDEFDGDAELNIGNLDRRELRLGANIPLSDRFALRASAYRADRGGEVENVLTGNEGSESENMGGKLRLLWDVSDSASVMLGYEKHELESIGTNFVMYEQYGDFQTTLSQQLGVPLLPIDAFARRNEDSAESIRNTDTEIWSLHANWDINETWSLTSVTGYQDFEQINNTAQLDPDGFSFQAIGPFSLNPFTNSNLAESLTQEIRFTMDTDEFSSVFGAFYADTDTLSFVPLARVSAILGPNATFPERTTVTTAIESSLDANTKEWAIFTHNTWNFTDRWAVIFGVRYSDVKKDDLRGTRLGIGDFAFLQGATPPSPLIPPNALPTSLWETPAQKGSWDAITGTLKFTVDITDDVTTYFGYDRGFKAGGFDTVSHDTSITGASAAFIVREPFDEEIGHNFEIGIKSFLFDRTISLNASAFYQVYQDFQVNVPDPVTTLLILKNADDVEVQGAELEFQWLASEQLVIDGNIAYVDSRFKKFEGAGCIRPQYAAVACQPTPTSDGDPVVQDLSGARLNQVSPWTANINATWTSEFANGMGWYLRGEYAFRDDKIFMYDHDTASFAPSYHLFNMSFALLSANETWEAILWGKNLADEEYFLDINANSADGAAVQGMRALLGEERTYGLTLRYNF